MNVTSFVFYIRQLLESKLHIFPEWVLYSLPDALWTYSLTAVMIIVWKNSQRKIKIFWISLGGILSIGGEIGQFLNLVTGTFDIKDLLLCFLGMILPLILLNLKVKERINYVIKTKF